MKKIYFIFGLALISLNLSAQHKESQNILDKLIWDDKMLNIMIDTRVDFQANIDNGEVTNTSFEAQTFKLWFVGEIVPGVRYRIRQRLNKPQQPTREGYSGATDQAWVAFDINKKWSITVGKQSVQFGTFEYDYNPADIYLPTMCFNDLDAYKTGVNAAFSFSKQRVNLQVVNSDAPQFASDDYKNKALAVNFLWEGDLFNEVLKTRWGYGLFQHNSKKFYGWLTLGTQLNLNKFTAELDYYGGNRNMDYGYMVDNTELGARYVQDQSLGLNLKYDFGKWRPSIKGIWDKRFDKNYDKTAYEDMGVEAVVEYYPFSGLLKDLRFHASYYFTSTHYKGMYSDLANEDNHTALVGMRWLFKAK